MNIPLPRPNMKCGRLVCVVHTKLIKHVLFNKTKNTRIRFSFMPVELFTAFQLAYLKLYVPW